MRPAPAVAGEYPAVGSACGWSATPVLSGGLVLLAGGGQDDEDGEVALLQGLGEDGERFRVTRVARGRSLEPAAPALLPDGDIALAVYEHDTSLQVCRVSRRGEVVARDELPADPYDVIAADLYSKLRVAVTAAGPDGYLCAWLYRQGRRQGTTRRRWGTADTGWRSEEWLLHAGADWVLGATPHPRRPRDDQDPWPYRLHQEQWVCRDVVTGAERWRTDGTGRIVVGMLGAGLVAVDLSAAERERCERADRMLGGYAADRVSLDELNRSDAEPVAAGSAVLILDPASGRTEWSTAVPGQIDSAACGPDGVSVVSIAADGAAWLHHLGRDGRLGFSGPLAGGVGRPVLAGRAEAGVVALAGDGADTALVLYPWDRAAPAWRLAVPRPAAAYPARAVDIRRLSVAPCLVTARRAYLRGRSALHVAHW